MLVRGTKDKEHAMAEALKNSLAFVGIDIGKNSFHENLSGYTRHKKSPGPSRGLV